MQNKRKVTLIGGGGIRTPLLVHGLAQAQSRLSLDEIAFYDVDAERLELMAALSREVIRQQGGEVTVTTSTDLAEAAAGAQFVLSSIRVGGIAARAKDEGVALKHQLAGQETTGVCGLAMALRTVPVALEQARTIERVAPEAWLVNFTNPAGMITQALTTHTKLRVVGICDTPSELFHHIAHALGEAPDDVRCEYAGLNHLGWVRRILVRGRDVTEKLLGDELALRNLYNADLFDPELIRDLRLVPSEYLFFYYSHDRARDNQLAVSTSRGREIERLTAELFEELRHDLKAQRADAAIDLYRDYLRRRSASYMRLEANAEASASEDRAKNWEDPFDAATGYHRIAIDVLKSLTSEQSSRVVVNVPNNGTIQDLAHEDVIEVPCSIDEQGVFPLAVGSLPESVRGLVIAVKSYERLAIRAAVEKSFELARLALLVNPMVGQWEIGYAVLPDLIENDDDLAYLSKPDVVEIGRGAR